MKKGFVITLDLIIAIFVVTSIIIVSINFLNVHNKEKDYMYLQTLGQDALTSLDKSNVLYNTIADKTSKDLRIFVNNLPANICGAVALYDETQSTVSVEKRECYASSDKISMYRSYLYNNTIYYVRIILWYG